MSNNRYGENYTGGYDFDDAPPRGGEGHQQAGPVDVSHLPPVGFYKAVGVQVSDESGTMRWAQWGWTKGSKEKEPHRQVMVYFRILDEGKWFGQQFPWLGHITKDAGTRTLEGLRIAGWRGDDLANLGALDQIVSVKFGHNIYDGKAYGRVDFVNKPGGGLLQLAQPMTTQELAAFSAWVKQQRKVPPEQDGLRYRPAEQAATPPERPAPAQQASAPAAPAPPPRNDDFGERGNQHHDNGYREQAPGPAPQNDRQQGDSDDDIPF